MKREGNYIPPTIVEIETDPLGATVPTDIHFQYVVAVALAKRTTVANVDIYCKYLARLAPDIAAMAAHVIINQNNQLAGNPALEALKIS